MSVATEQHASKSKNESGQMARVIVLDDIASEGLAMFDAADGIESTSEPA